MKNVIEYRYIKNMKDEEIIMKKILSILLALTMVVAVFGLVACNETPADDNAPAENNEQPAENNEQPAENNNPAEENTPAEDETPAELEKLVCGVTIF